MTVFTDALEQTAFLFLFILAGYVLCKGRFVPDNARATLSSLENTLFIPALVLSTFMGHFTRDKLQAAWQLFSGSFVLGLLFILLALLCVRLITKDSYERGIYAYGLSFSNFGFMGNAVVSALFPEMFMEYLIFTLPLWTLIYLWGVPVLLMGDGQKQPLKKRLNNFLNPMFIAMALGMLMGLCGLRAPAFITSAVEAAGQCMSPVAMLLTGMTIARYDLKDILRQKGVYVVSALRLIAFPLLFMAAARLIPLPRAFYACALCSLAMPLGLNTVIIPSALGKDTRLAAGMALVSHVAGCLTIPLLLG